MLFLLLLSCLVTILCGIHCDDTTNVVYVGVYEHSTCFVAPNHTFHSGSKVKVTAIKMLENDITLANVTMKSSKENVTSFKGNFDLQRSNSSSVLIPDTNETYILTFRFKYDMLPNIQGPRYLPNCTTTISFAPNAEPVEYLDWKIPAAAVGVSLGILIIALSATTIYYKRKAKSVNRHKNLNMRTDRIEDEEQNSDRYCSNPLRKAKKGAQIFDEDRESGIYEDPKATLGVSPMPPALPTSPRPGRNFMTMKTEPSPSLTNRSTNASPQATFPRSKPKDKDTLTKISMANRPPLPLPQDEFYKEAQEDDTYEPPPIHELLARTPVAKRRGNHDQIAKALQENIARPRPEAPAKSVQEKFGKKFPHIPMDALKPPGMNKPPKHHVPGPHVMPTNQRNNAVQVPIRPIPDTSSLKKGPKVKPKPPIALPQTIPTPTKIPEDHHNKRRDSSDDDEWTYEPLPNYNIYSI